MSFVRQTRERQLALTALGVLGASALAGAAIGASRLGLVVPPASSGSLHDALAIFANNVQIWVLVGAATLLQPRGVEGLAAGRLPLWLTDLAVGAVITFNLIALGGVLGALGAHALVRVLPHAPLELGGFLLALIAYLRARRGELCCAEAVRFFALAVALIACGAFVESYVSGGLA